MAASYHKPKKKSSSHKSFGGSSGYKGYKGKKSGKKGKSHKSKHFSKKGAQKKGNHDSKKYFGDMKKGNKGHKAAKYGKKGHHAKGHKTKGFKNTYHKNEYSKKTKFYDEYDNGGYHKKYGGYKGYYGGSKGSKFKGGKDKAGYYGDKYGKKGYDSKGSHHDAHKGEKGSYGHKGKYGSKKGKGGGGYGHEHGHHGGYGRSLPNNPVPDNHYDYDDQDEEYGLDHGSYAGGFVPSRRYPDTAPQVNHGQDSYDQEYRGGYYPNSPYHDAPEATTTKFSYVPKKKQYSRPKYSRNNHYRNHATSGFDYDDYNEEDLGDYNGYDYALEAEQKREAEEKRKKYGKSRENQPRKSSDMLGYEYKDHPEPMRPRSYGSHESTTENPRAAYYKKPAETPYYIPQEPLEEEGEPRRRNLSQKKPLVKNVRYYQDLSDPKENRRGYSKGFYQAWDSKAKPNKYKSAKERIRNRRRYQDFRMSNSKSSRHPFSGFYDE